MAVWGIQYSANLMFKNSVWAMFGFCWEWISPVFSKDSVEKLCQISCSYCCWKIFSNNPTIPDKFEPHLHQMVEYVSKTTLNNCNLTSCNHCLTRYPCNNKIFVPYSKRSWLCFCFRCLETDLTHSMYGYVWSLYLHYSLNYPNKGKYTMHLRFGILIPKEW